MSLRRIRKGDEIVVTTGKDKGRTGTVLSVVSDERVLVENINVARKHQRANPNAGVQGGIIEREMPIHSSNVQLVNPATGKADRVGVRTLEDGRKVRFFKSDGEVIDA
jgi:large subunit ribosomal protein L24